MIYLLRYFWEFNIIWFCVLKDSPLLHILEMYELCMNCKKYNEAKTKLDQFQESLTKVRKLIFSECHCWDLPAGLFTHCSLSLNADVLTILSILIFCFPELLLTNIPCP